MFTDNYIQFKKAAFTSVAPSYNVYLKNHAATRVKACAGGFGSGDIGGHLLNVRFTDLEENKNTYWKLATDYAGVFFGSGTTPATRADYKLEAPIKSGLTVTTPSALAWNESGNGEYTVSVDYIIRNTTDADITIGEIGVFTPVTSQSDGALSSYATMNFVLMERTVLDEPLVIPAGGAKLMTYKITFNQT